MKFKGHHFGLFFDFRFGCTVSALVPVGMLDPKNMSVAVGFNFVDILSGSKDKCI